MSLTGRAGTGVAGVVGLGLGLLALGPGAGPGYLLSYDMVFVPKPPFTEAMFGRGGTLPRAVPSDAVVAALAHLVPADLVQKLLLLAIFALACAGAAALLAGERLVVRLVAGVCYAWNPFVAERLILGQWALLLGYAGLPWVLCVLVKSAAAGPWRLAWPLALALLPAAVGGFAAMAVSALAAVPAAALAGGRRAIRVLVTCTVLGVLSLPWLLPALASPVHTSTSGVSAFAARADTPFGAFGSLVLLGGAWNSQTVPYGYGGPAVVAWLAVVLLALAGFALLGARRWPGLAVAAVAGLAIACIGITETGAGLLRWLIAAWPGFAVLRDGQQFVAPLALAEAAGLGLGVAWLLGKGPAAAGRPARSRWLSEGRWLVVTLALIVPLVLLPGLGWGAAGRLRAVQYPADWMAARRKIDQDKAAGKVLLLPWAAYRRFGWNHGEAMLDPWPRLVSRDVIWNDAVSVGRITIPAESPQARALTARISGSGPLTSVLLAAGVRYVIIDSGFGPYRSRLPGCQVVLAGPGLVVYRLPAAPPRE